MEVASTVACTQGLACLVCKCMQTCVVYCVHYRLLRACTDPAACSATLHE